MLAAESILVAGATCSVIIGMDSLCFGESNWWVPFGLWLAESVLGWSGGFSSAEGDVEAGNFQAWACENDGEALRLVEGGPAALGVFGTVIAPGRREGRGDRMASLPGEGKKEFRRGEGCVDDRWPSGAIYLSVVSSFRSARRSHRTMVLLH